MRPLNRLQLARTLLILCAAFWGLLAWLLYAPLPRFSETYGWDAGYVWLVLGIVLIAVILTPVAVTMFYKELLVRNPKSERFASGPLAKTLAALAIATLLAGSYCAIRSVWYGTNMNGYADRITYENTATGLGYAAMLLVSLLSAVQKNIYWATRKGTDGLDERELHERHGVLNRSYRLSVFILIGATIFLANTLHSLPAIISINNGHVPGILLWLPVNLILLLYALPLLVAAWKKQ